MKLIFKKNIPWKNCTMSSLVDPKGRPLNLTQLSSNTLSSVDPVFLITHSISERFDRNTKYRKH